jgi:hypothetical protein
MSRVGYLHKIKKTWEADRANKARNQKETIPPVEDFGANMMSLAPDDYVVVTRASGLHREPYERRPTDLFANNADEGQLVTYPGDPEFIKSPIGKPLSPEQRAQMWHRESARLLIERQKKADDWVWDWLRGYETILSEGTNVPSVAAVIVPLAERIQDATWNYRGLGEFLDLSAKDKSQNRYDQLKNKQLEISFNILTAVFYMDLSFNARYGPDIMGQLSEKPSPTDFSVLMGGVLTSVEGSRTLMQISTP